MIEYRKGGMIFPRDPPVSWCSARHLSSLPSPFLHPHSLLSPLSFIPHPSLLIPDSWILNHCISHHSNQSQHSMSNTTPACHLPLPSVVVHVQPLVTPFLMGSTPLTFCLLQLFPPPSIIKPSRRCSVWALWARAHGCADTCRYQKEDISILTSCPITLSHCLPAPLIASSPFT